MGGVIGGETGKVGWGQVMKGLICCVEKFTQEFELSAVSGRTLLFFFLIFLIN